jgi:hypothetical protein
MNQIKIFFTTPGCGETNRGPFPSQEAAMAEAVALHQSHPEYRIRVLNGEAVIWTNF